MLQTLITEVANYVGHFGQEIDSLSSIYDLRFCEHKFWLNLTISVKYPLKNPLGKGYRAMC